jgi:hypothetical protein
LVEQNDEHHYAQTYTGNQKQTKQTKQNKKQKAKKNKNKNKAKKMTLQLRELY